MRRVAGHGPENALVAVIGEAPGENEERQGEPFVGKSGGLLKQWWDEVGIDKWGVYKDNVVQVRPPGNEIAAIPREEVEKRWVPELYERLSRLKNVRVIVPTGNLACSALLGRQGEKLPGVLAMRGGVYCIPQFRHESRSGGDGPWCVPTIHPAWFLRGQMAKQGRALSDWRKIKYISEHGHKKSTRTVLAEPSSDELAYFRGCITGHLAIDIETLGEGITCVGFAVSKDISIVLPVLTMRQKERYWPVVKQLCESSFPKVMQNGHYDTYWLRHFGVEVRNWTLDTMWMHHALDPSDNHGLQYLASLYSKDFRAWKDERESGDEKDFGGRVKDPRALWEYNGKDCMYTWEVGERLLEELKSAGLMEFYQRHYAQSFGPVLDTMCHGVRVDTEAQLQVREQLLEENAGIRRKLKELAGYELYAVEEKIEWRTPTVEERKILWREGKQGKPVYAKDKAKELGYAGASKKGLVGVKSEVLKLDFSGLKLRKYFYEDLGLQKQMKLAKGKEGKKRTVSLDETALVKLAGKYPQKAGEAVRLILKHRENKGEADDFNEKWDKDGRIRCQYSFNTEAGRFASKANPMRSGRNLQNVKRGPQRRTYLPDGGCIFLAIDGSQVEDRVVKMLTGSARLVELANTRPGEFDAHTYNAGRIFGVSESEVTKSQRSLGKMAVHAAQRGMRGNRLADRLLTEAGVVHSPAYCQKLIDAYLDDHWEIREWYFVNVRQAVLARRELWNTWGRRWRCAYDPMDDDLYRRAYSYLPQSECNELMVQWGYLKAMGEIKVKGLDSRVNLLVHDEIILSCPPHEVYALARELVRSLERPRSYPSGELVVPMTVSLGRNWGEKVEIGELPGEEEFNARVKEVMGR